MDFVRFFVYCFIGVWYYTHLGLEDAKDEMVRLEELNKAREEVEKTNGDEPMDRGMFRVG